MTLRASVAWVALCLTLLNAAKPLTVDDPVFVTYARHIAEQPADPYGFEVFWSQRVVKPAAQGSAPPVFLYALAGAVSVFGDRPLLWKLSLFPFALALVAGFAALLRRATPGLEVPLLWMAAFSPAVLPSSNLMLDVPALALGLLAVGFVVRGCESGRAVHALAAGLLAGLAMQTKYTALMPVAAALMHAVVHGRWRLAAFTGATAALVFGSWEIFTALRYGESQLLYGLRAMSPYGPRRDPVSGGIGLLCLLGATAPAVGLLGLIALRLRRAWIAAATGAISLVFALVPILPADAGAEPNLFPELDTLGATGLLFLAIGVFVACAAVAIGRRVFASALAAAPTSRGRTPARVPGEAKPPQIATFALAWVAVEAIGFYLISPFLAVRRVMGLELALLLLTGLAAARAVGPGRGLREVRAVACWGVAVGLLFAATDLADAHTRRSAVSLTSAELAKLGADRDRETVWFMGHWGFRYYAERDGMRPLVPNRSSPRRGDWVAVPSNVFRQRIRKDPDDVTRRGRVDARSPWPWSTIPSAYGGAVAIRRQSDPHVSVSIFRVERGFVARSGEGARSRKDPPADP